MYLQPKIIKITPRSKLLDLLEEAKKTPVILKRDDDAYRLIKEKKKSYDSKAIQNTLKNMPAILSDKEADEMIAYIYRVRKVGSRPIARP